MQRATLLIGALALVAVGFAGGYFFRGDGTSLGEVDRGTRVESVPTPKSGEVSVATEYPLGESVRSAIGNTTTVHSYEPFEVEGCPQCRPDAGMQFVSVDVEFCAGEEPTTSAPEIFHLEMADKTRYDFGSAGYPRKPEFPFQGTVPPNECVRGWISFQAPQNESPKYVLFDSSSLIRWRIT